MGFRFHRRIRIAPGLTLNLNKGGTSLSAGVRGLHTTIGRRSQTTIGAPGTGLSYTHYHRRGGRGRGHIGILGLLAFGWLVFTILQHLR